MNRAPASNRSQRSNRVHPAPEGDGESTDRSEKVLTGDEEIARLKSLAEERKRKRRQEAIDKAREDAEEARKEAEKERKSKDRKKQMSRASRSAGKSASSSAQGDRSQRPEEDEDIAVSPLPNVPVRVYRVNKSSPDAKMNREENARKSFIDIEDPTREWAKPGLPEQKPAIPPHFREYMAYARTSVTLLSLFIFVITLVGYHAYFGGILLFSNSQVAKLFYVYREPDRDKQSNLIYVTQEGKVGVGGAPHGADLDIFVPTSGGAMRMTGEATASQAAKSILSFALWEDAGSSSLTPARSPLDGGGIIKDLTMTMYSPATVAEQGVAVMSADMNVQSEGFVNGTVDAFGSVRIKCPQTQEADGQECVNFDFKATDTGSFNIERTVSVSGTNSTPAVSIVLSVDAEGELLFQSTLRVKRESIIEADILSSEMSFAGASFESLQSHSTATLYSYNFSSYWHFEQELATDKNQVKRYTIYADHSRQMLRLRRGSTDFVVFDQETPATATAARRPRQMHVLEAPKITMSQTDKFIASTTGVSVVFDGMKNASTIVLKTQDDLAPAITVGNTTISHSLTALSPITSQRWFTIANSRQTDVTYELIETSSPFGESSLQTKLSFVDRSILQWHGNDSQMVFQSSNITSLNMRGQGASATVGIQWQNPKGTFSLLSTLPQETTRLLALNFKSPTLNHTLLSFGQIVSNGKATSGFSATMGVNDFTVADDQTLGPVAVRIASTVLGASLELNTANSSSSVEIVFSTQRDLSNTTAFRLLSMGESFTVNYGNASVVSFNKSRSLTVHSQTFVPKVDFQHTGTVVKLLAGVHVLHSIKFAYGTGIVMSKTGASSFGKLAWDTSLYVSPQCDLVQVHKNAVAKQEAVIGQQAYLKDTLYLSSNASLMFSDVRIYSSSATRTLSLDGGLKLSSRVNVVDNLVVFDSLNVTTGNLIIPQQTNVSRVVNFGSEAASQSSISYTSAGELFFNTSQLRAMRNLRVLGDVMVIGDVQASFSTNPGFGTSFIDVGSEVTPAKRTGLFIRMIVGNDGRLFSVYKEGQEGALRAAYCYDQLCKDVKVSTLEPNNVIGRLACWIGRNGFPQIAFATSDNFLVVGTCKDFACTEWAVRSRLVQCTFGDTIAGMISAEGFPLLVHVGADRSVATSCVDVTCSNTPTQIQMDIDRAAYVSMAISADGRPIIAMYFISASTLKVIKCSDVACRAAPGTAITVDGSGSVAGAFVDIKIGNDNLPIMSYQYDSRILRVLHCGTADCSALRTLTDVVTNADGRPTGEHTSLVIGPDSVPVIAFYDSGHQTLSFARCRDERCTTGATTVTIDPTVGVGKYPSLLFGPDMAPTIAYYDEGAARAKMIHCANAFCVPYVRF